MLSALQMHLSLTKKAVNINNLEHVPLIGSLLAVVQGKRRKWFYPCIMGWRPLYRREHAKIAQAYLDLLHYKLFFCEERSPIPSIICKMSMIHALQSHWACILVINCLLSVSLCARKNTCGPKNSLMPGVLEKTQLLFISILFIFQALILSIHPHTSCHPQPVEVNLKIFLFI